MNSKLLLAITRLTAAVVLSSGDGLSLIHAAEEPAQEHAGRTLDSGLWRAQFPERDTETPPADPDAFPVPANSVAPPIVELPAADVSEMLPTGSAGIRTEADRHARASAEDATLSDWDHAVAVSVGTTGRRLTSTGPSLISMVVAAVGLIVTVGAYLTGEKKNQGTQSR